YISWAVGYFRIESNDRILGTAPFHFDMSTFDIFASMAAGASLCIATEDELLFPAMLARRMESERVTLWKGVSSILGFLARAGVARSSSVSTLTRVAFSGERLPAKYLREWMMGCPHVQFYNVYGPTEATGVSTAFEIGGLPESDDEDVPIGQACANTEVL